MSKKGFVIGPAPGLPPPYVVYPQAPQPVGGTIYVPSMTPGTRIVIRQTPMVPATYIPPPAAQTSTLIYVNRQPRGQLGVLGSRIGATIGSVVDSALSPPQQTCYHQYAVQQPGVQYPPPWSQPGVNYPEPGSQPGAQYPPTGSQPWAQYPSSGSQPGVQYPPTGSQPGVQYPHSESPPSYQQGNYPEQSKK